MFNARFDISSRCIYVLTCNINFIDFKNLLTQIYPNCKENTHTVHIQLYVVKTIIRIPLKPEGIVLMIFLNVAIHKLSVAK